MACRRSRSRRNSAPDTPFIFLSGTIGEERAIDALQRGAYDYVLKTNMARLVPAVRRALNDASIRRAQVALEQQLRDIVATSQDWIWEHDRDGKFTFCSDSVRSTLGYSPEEILGRNASQFVHPEDLAALDFAMHTLGANQRTASNLQARWRHRNGSYRWLERNMLALLGENGQVIGFRGSERDFTERRRQEKHISRLTRVLKMLSGVNSAMVRIRQRREILVEACRLATAVGGYASAMVALIEPGTRTARPTAWSGSVDNHAAQQLTFSIADDASDDASVIGRVLRTGTSMVCNDLQQLDMGLAARASLMDSGFRSVVAYPLLVDKTPVGALMLTAYDVGAVGDEESRMLRELVANLSFALQYLHKEDEVRFLSYFDPLTSLAKRGLFCERLVRALEPRIGRRGTPAVAVLDIEQLSSINDSFGRHAGDLLLQQVADRLKRHLDSTELLAHFGGGTFGLIMEAAGDEDEAVHWMQEQVAEAFRAPFIVDGRGIPVDVKCGFARYPDNGNDANALVQNAEAALRSAKSTGEKYLPHRLELSSAVVSRMTMEHRLRAAVERQEFELHYQTKVDVRTHADPRPRGAGPLARSGGGPGDAGRVPAADGNLRPHRAARRLDPAAGGHGPSSLAGCRTFPGPRGSEYLAGAVASPLVCRSLARPGGRVAQREHRHRHRNHRRRAHRRCELGRLTTARSAPLRCARGHRRFRHGLFLVEQARRAARGHAQDRPQLHQRTHLERYRPHRG